MKVSQKVDYACRALAYLAQRHDGGQLFRTEEISEVEEIPQNFLSLILNDLKKRGFLTSKRGKAGGWRLSQDPAQVTLLQVVEALEPELVNYEGMKKGASCEAVEGCWEEVSSLVRKRLGETSLEGLSGGAADTMYYI